MFTTKRVPSAIAAAALLTISAAVSASNAPIEQSAAVRFGDLNLDRQADVATLYQRIGAAADQLCRTRVGLYDTLYRYQGCMAESVRSAVGRVNRAALTDYYRQQEGTETAIKVARQ